MVDSQEATHEAIGNAMARSFARVIARMRHTHPTTAGIVQATWMLAGCDDAWLAEILPKLEKEWPKEGK